MFSQASRKTYSRPRHLQKHFHDFREYLITNKATHSLDCASDLSSDQTLFSYNMMLRPKYGRYLSRFQILGLYLEQSLLTDCP